MKKYLHDQTGVAHILLIGLLVVLIVGVGAMAVMVRIKTKAPTAADKTAKFVTAAPVDFEQMESISKFRSCAGHDYSGKNIDGVVETERSMKHYAVPVKTLANTTGKVKIFAPFDAVVINNSEGKKGDNLDLSPTAASGWVYELGHIESLKSLPEGSHVKSGDLLGYYNDGGAFDLQFWYGDKHTVNTLQGHFDSLFAHMTPELAAKLAPFGLSADNLIVSKAERDAHPCTGTTKDMGSTIFTGDYAKDIIQIKNAAASAAPTSSGSGGAPSSAAGTGECSASIPAAQRPPGCKN